MLDAGEKNVPFLMPLRGNSAAAGECLLQQFNPGHAVHDEFAPVRETSAAALAADLIREKGHHAFLNTIVLRLGEAKLAFVRKAQQPLL